jgi:5-enolpyruvylshikimate-3-phosphate synthase
MAIHIASLGTPEKMEVDIVECINKSFPKFLPTFKSLKEK